MSRRPAVRFSKVHHGVFARRAEAGSSLRYSTYVRELRKQGATQDALDEFERDRLAAAHCAEHGQIADPIIGLVGEGSEARVAFACPWCSGPEVLAAWEKEGRRS